MNIRTNNHVRPLLGFYDLSEKERTEVGSAYDIVGAQFVRYREWVYAMDDFVGTTAPEFEGWHGVYPESYFSGVLVRLSDDGETVQTICQVDRITGSNDHQVGQHHKPQHAQGVTDGFDERHQQVCCGR